MSLEDYKKKRDFNKSPEPAPGKAGERGNLFVVQKHYASRLHYDFRMEAGGVLKSWAVPKGPSLNPKDKRLAMLVEDHPLDYARFEGEIPEGSYGAGKVIVWDIGKYKVLENKNFEAGFLEGNIKFKLEGEKINGEFALVKIKGRSKKENEWLLLKKQDEFASQEDVLKKNCSVISDLCLADQKEEKQKKQIDFSGAKKGEMLKSVKPMLSKLAEAPFDKPGWIFEIKWDGYRAIAEISLNGGKKIKLYSRNLQPFDKKYPGIVDALKNIRQEAVLDGEVVVTNEQGLPKFQLLQDWEGGRQGKLVYVVFDILYLDGFDLQSLPLIKRKEILKTVILKIPDLQFSDYIKEKGMDFFQAAKKQGLEGIMAKNGQSIYEQGKRTGEWQKIKILNIQGAVICGYTRPRGARKYFGALVLGAYKDGQLVYIGHSGGGFSEKNMPEILKRMEKLEQKDSPFENIPKTNEEVKWLRPELVCQIKFQEWTQDGVMRHPIFLGLRKDKKAEEVEIEKPNKEAKNFSPQEKEFSGPVMFTNLEKIYWPNDKITKKDLIYYYEKISPVILPYLKDRPQSLNRHPNGIEGESFFQKNFVDAPDWVQTKLIKSEGEEKDINYIICNNKETLLYMANLGCIEINPWSSRINSLDYPDYAILDIDPNGMPFEEAIRASLEMKKILDVSDVASFCKTSGKSGIHILVPLGAKYTYEQARNFSELICRIVQQALPKTTSVERSPGKRERKVYLDFLQNRRGQTISAPYCVRPVDGATVSTPLGWDELEKGINPKDFTVETIFKRLDKKGDIFFPVLWEGADLEKALKKMQKF